MIRNIICLLLAVMVFASCDKEDKIIPQEDLPTAAQDYIDTHFPDIAITQVLKDRDGLRNSYEVYLKDGTALEFDRNGAVESIQRTEKLPDSVIPARIAGYIAVNYPDVYVTAWSLDDRHQEVELSNRLELQFDMEGNFLRIDS